MRCGATAAIGLVACFSKPAAPVGGVTDATVDTVIADLPACAGSQQWSPPQPLTDVNYPGVDESAALRPQGDVLVFQTARRGMGADIYFARTQSPGFAMPMLGLDSASNETSPVWSGDGTRIYYQEAGEARVADYDPVGASLGTPRDPRLAEFAQIPMAIVHPTFTTDDRVMVFSDSSDLYGTARVGEQFAPPASLGPLNSGTDDESASMTPDGRTLYFVSSRSGQRLVYTASRPTVAMSFSSPVPLPSLGPNISTVSVSADGMTLFFSTQGDIFTSTRTCD